MLRLVLPVIAVVLALAIASGQSAAPPIAVVDTGIQCAHEALSGKCLPGFYVAPFTSDQDDSTLGHGTQMADLASRSGASVIPVKVCNHLGHCADDDTGSGVTEIAAGIRWAADSGARIITASLYGLTYWQALQDAVDYANARGVLVIAIAGNTGLLTPTPDPETVYPLGARTGMLVVGGSEGAGVYSGSTLSSYVDVLAPATAYAAGCAPAVGFVYQNPCAVVWDGGAFGHTGPVYWTTTGTSVSAPQVAAIAWSMLEANPALTPAAIEALIKQTAIPACAVGCGAGVVNGAAAIQAARDSLPTPTVTATPTPTATPCLPPKAKRCR